MGSKLQEIFKYAGARLEYNIRTNNYHCLYRGGVFVISREERRMLWEHVKRCDYYVVDRFLKTKIIPYRVGCQRSSLIAIRKGGFGL